MTNITEKMIININETAKENFEKAKGMLEMLNTLYNTKYGWLAKRVVRFENPDGSTAEKYAAAHDLQAELWYKEKFTK